MNNPIRFNYSLIEGVISTHLGAKVVINMTITQFNNYDLNTIIDNCVEYGLASQAKSYSLSFCYNKCKSNHVLIFVYGSTRLDLVFKG
jgi:hypothetical protein